MQWQGGYRAQGILHAHEQPAYPSSSYNAKSSNGFPSLEPYHHPSSRSYDMPAQTLQQPIPYHPHRQQQHAQQPPAIFAYSHPDPNPYHQQQTPCSYFSFSPPLTASSSSSSGTSPSLSELAQLAGLDLDAPFHPLPVPALSLPRAYHPTIVNNTSSSNVSSRPLSPASVLRRQARLDSFSDSLSGPSSSSSSSYIPPFSPPYHHHIAPTSTSLPSRISSWIPSFPPPSSALDQSTPQYRSSQRPPGSSSSSGGEKKRRSSTSNLLVSSGLGLGQKLASQLASSTSSASSSAAAAAAAAKIGKHVCPSEGCSYSFSRKDALLRHAKSHLPFDPSRPFPCENIAFCGKAFACRESLEKHVGPGGCR